MHLLRQINNGSVCSLLFLSMARLFPAHGKVLEHEMQLSPPEGVGIGESLAYVNGVAMGWPLAYLWHIHGVPMAYLCNSFVLSGIDFIFGMVLV